MHRSNAQPGWENWNKIVRIDAPFKRGYFLGPRTRCECEYLDSPKCVDLITNAVSALSNRERWPDHWNDGVFEETCNRWARSFRWQGSLDSIILEPPENDPMFATFAGGELALRHWMHQWPLPVGWRSLAREIETNAFPIISKPQQLLNMMPFDDTQYAALIVWGQFDLTFCTCFCLALPEFNSDGVIQGYRGGQVEVLISEPRYSHPDLLKFAKGASDWWGQFSGLKVQKGRPVGSTDRPLSEYTEKLLLLASEMNGKPPSLDRFSERWLIPDRTIKRNLKSWGMGSWSIFRRKVLEESR